MTAKLKKATSKTTRRGFGRESIIRPAAAPPNLPSPLASQPDIVSSITTYSDTHSSHPSMPDYSPEASANFTHVTQIRIDAHLFESIHNAVESAIFGGNYTIESASHFIREALKEHVAGAPLKVAHENGAKKSLSIRMDERLKCFWDTLPKRHRNNILERAVRTKLLSYQN